MVIYVYDMYVDKNDYTFVTQVETVLGVAVLCFASIVYMCETELSDYKHASENQNVTWTFLDSFLWSLMTITTVGQENNPSVGNKKFIESHTLCMKTNVRLN